jgi:chromosome segregation ATPase
MGLHNPAIPVATLQGLEQTVQALVNSVQLLSAVVSAQTQQTQQTQRFLEEAANAMATTLENMQTLMETIYAERQEVSDALAAHRSSITNLNAQVGELQTQAQNQGQTIQNQQSTIAALQSSLDQMGVDAHSYQDLINQLNAQVTSLQDSNASFASEMNLLNGKIMEAIGEVENIYNQTSQPLPGQP